MAGSSSSSGANIDALETARNFGLDPSRAMQYTSDSQGTRENYEIMCGVISTVRENRSLDDETWKGEGRR